MDALESWTRTEVTFDGETRDVYRKGVGRGVIVIHEFPGIEDSLVSFAQEVVDAGFTVMLPRLFGTPGAGFSFSNIAGDVRQFCVRREFSVFARGRTSPVAVWLRALARQLHDDAGGEGIGVVGMCFTGGFGLAMMAGAPVIAPVIAEPSLPAGVGLPRNAAARGADLGLSPLDLEAVTSSGCAVLGLRYRTDPATGTRFATLRRLLGDRFLAVEFEGKGHSVLTADRREYGLDEVLDFLDRTLNDEPTRQPRPRNEPLEKRLESPLGAASPRRSPRTRHGSCCTSNGGSPRRDSSARRPSHVRSPGSSPRSSGSRRRGCSGYSGASTSVESAALGSTSTTGAIGITTDSTVGPRNESESADSIAAARLSASDRDGTGSEGSPAHSVGSSGRVLNIPITPLCARRAIVRPSIRHTTSRQMCSRPVWGRTTR